MQGLLRRLRSWLEFSGGKRGGLLKRQIIGILGKTVREREKYGGSDSGEKERRTRVVVVWFGVDYLIM